MPTRPRAESARFCNPQVLCRPSRRIPRPKSGGFESYVIYYETNTYVPDAERWPAFVPDLCFPPVRTWKTFVPDLRHVSRIAQNFQTMPRALTRWVDDSDTAGESARQCLEVGAERRDPWPTGARRGAVSGIGYDRGCQNGLLGVIQQNGFCRNGHRDP